MAELLGTIIVQQRTHFHDRSGLFLAECDKAAVASAEQLAQAVEAVADGMAWSKSKPITATSHGFSAVTSAFGTLARIQEFGARPHVIESHEGPRGDLANQETGFFSAHAVMHPGVKAQRFLSKAGRAVAQMGPALIARNWPK